MKYKFIINTRKAFIRLTVVSFKLCKYGENSQPVKSPRHFQTTLGLHLREVFIGRIRMTSSCMDVMQLEPNVVLNFHDILKSGLYFLSNPKKVLLSCRCFYLLKIHNVAVIVLFNL